MISTTKILTGFLTGTVLALALTTTPSQAQNALYLTLDATHCEIFRGLSRDVPMECQTRTAKPHFKMLRSFGRTRGLVIYDQAQPAHVASADRAEERKELSIAFRAEFEFDSHRLTKHAEQVIDRVAQVLKHDKMRNNVIQIEGHADATGAETYNLTLSQKRALAVRQYLVSHHKIDPSRLRFVGKGESEPYDPKNPNAGINRRVEFKNITG